MALKDRLEAAREDYRALPTVHAPEPSEPEHGRRRGRILAVAAVVVLVGGGIGWWSRSDDPATVEAGPATDSSERTDVYKSDDPNPPGAVAAYADEISLDPSGPYTDGQVVTLSVPEGFAADLINGTPAGARQCAVLADGPGGSGEWCDPVDRAVQGTATPSSVDVRLNRIVFTPTGERDCEDPAVTCRVVLSAVRGGDVASGVLRFTGADSDPFSAIEVSGTGNSGEVMLALSGVEPHPSWIELRASDPARAAGFGPFWVSVCAFGKPDEPTDPWGTNQWDTAIGGRSVPGPNCDQYNEVATIDADDLSTPTPANVPTWFLGYGGWNDCRSDRCFIQIRRTIAQGVMPGGGLLGGDEVVATALVPPGLVDPDGARPELRITTPGPHAAGQELTIDVSGLPDGRATNVGVCQTGTPWSCGYLGPSMGQIDDGTHVIRLPDQFTCADHCYLELDSQGEGMPPLATAALDTDG